MTTNANQVNVLSPTITKKTFAQALWLQAQSVIIITTIFARVVCANLITKIKDPNALMQKSKVQTVLIAMIVSSPAYMTLIKRRTYVPQTILMEIPAQKAMNVTVEHAGIMFALR
jgi:hypothetical protein